MDEKSQVLAEIRTLALELKPIYETGAHISQDLSPQLDKIKRKAMELAISCEGDYCRRSEDIVHAISDINRHKFNQHYNLVAIKRIVRYCTVERRKSITRREFIRRTAAAGIGMAVFGKTNLLFGAPRDIGLEDAHGKKRSLAEYHGKTILLLVAPSQNVAENKMEAWSRDLEKDLGEGSKDFIIVYLLVLDGSASWAKMITRHFIKKKTPKNRLKNVLIDWGDARTKEILEIKDKNNPALFMINQDGKIIHRHQGPLNTQAIAQIKKLV
jgi:hypothetical protein